MNNSSVTTQQQQQQQQQQKQQNNEQLISGYTTTTQNNNNKNNNNNNNKTIALPPQSWLGTRRAVSSLAPQRERGGRVLADEYSSALSGKREAQCISGLMCRPIPRLA